MSARGRPTWRASSRNRKAGPGTAAPTGGAPPLAGAQRGIPPAAAQPATVGNTITGTVAIGSEIQIDDPSRSMLFVIARKHGVTSGPPVAVLRIPSPRFPMPFEIGPADVMIPSMRFEGDLSISARLDGDGNAMTRTPGDLQGSTTDPLQPGARNVEVLLDQTI